MKKPTISTIIIIICLLIIALYAMGEVNYYSSKIIAEKNIDSPIILIGKIGVEEKINNVSLNQGVLSDPGKNIPTKEGPTQKKLEKLFKCISLYLNIINILF